MLHDDLDDPLIAPPGPPACIPGLTPDLTRRVRRLQRWAVLNALRDNGVAMAACIEASPRGRRRPWRRHRD